MKENNDGIILSMIYAIIAFNLFIVFLVLKLCGVVDWGWWLVTLPLWCGTAAFIAFIAVVWIIYAAWLLARTIKVKRIEKEFKKTLERGKHESI